MDITRYTRPATRPKPRADYRMATPLRHVQVPNRRPVVQRPPSPVETAMQHHFDTPITLPPQSPPQSATAQPPQQSVPAYQPHPLDVSAFTSTPAMHLRSHHNVSFVAVLIALGIGVAAGGVYVGSRVLASPASPPVSSVPPGTVIPLIK